MSDPIPVGKETRVRCYAIMTRHNFNSEKRREWSIWAAKHHSCSECKAPKNSPCLNLVDLRVKPREFAKPNRNPHDSRIDWERLLEGLLKRGYTELDE